MEDLKNLKKDIEQSLEQINKYFYQQDKEKSKMANVGSIQQKSEVATKQLSEINSLINDFNQAGAKILIRESGETKMYTPEYVQNLQKQETENHLKNFRPKVEQLLNDALSWLKLSINQKDEIRFPFRYSSDANKATLGELRSMRAQNFVSSAKDPKILMSEVLLAYRSDADYFNSLVNAILMAEPVTDLEKSDLLKDNPNQAKLFADVRGIYKEFADVNNLTVLDVAITTFLTIATEATSFLNAIKARNIYFMPQRMAEKMDQNEVARNVEIINSSMPYWGTKLEGLNFVHQIV